MHKSKGSKECKRIISGFSNKRKRMKDRYKFRKKWKLRKNKNQKKLKNILSRKTKWGKTYLRFNQKLVFNRVINSKIK